MVLSGGPSRADTATPPGRYSSERCELGQTCVGPSWWYGAARGAWGGMVYGAVVAAVSHPFDTIKCRQQLGAPTKWSMLQLYRGVAPSMAASVMFRAVPFIGYEAVGHALRKQVDDSAPLLVAFAGSTPACIP